MAIIQRSIQLRLINTATLLLDFAIMSLAKMRFCVIHAVKSRLSKAARFARDLQMEVISLPGDWPCSHCSHAYNHHRALLLRLPAPRW